MKDIKKLKEERGRLLRESQDLITSVRRANRNVTSAEDGKLANSRTRIFEIDCELEQLESEVRGLATRQSSPLPNLAGYSICRAINLASQGRLDGLEGEVSEEIARRSGKSPNGFYVPHDVLVEARAMSVTGGTTSQYGGDFVQTSVNGFIDALRPMMKVGQAGATILDRLSSNVAIPRQSAASTATWKAETASLDEATPEIDQLELSPKRVGAYTVLSKQLVIQSSPDVERLVRNDLMSACAIALDAAAINGSGSNNQPTGILQTNGIGSVVGGTNGAAPDWNDIVDLVGAVEDANATGAAPAFMTNSSVAAKLRATVKVSGTDSRMILEGSTLLDHPVHISNNVPSDLDKGSSTGVCSAIIYGHFDGVVLASFGDGVDLIVDPFTLAKEGQNRVVVNSYVDVGVRRAAMFAAMQDALTS